MTSAKVAFALAAAIAGSALVITACGSAPARDQIVTISAASSLSDVLARAEEDFEQENPTIDVRLNIAGSGTIINQILEGAPIDVVLTADRTAMDQLGGAVFDVDGLLANRLVLIYRADLGEITDVAQLLDRDLVIVACDVNVPCGRLTERTLRMLSVDIPIDSREANVRITRQRVLSGEADAAFVYESDLRGIDASIGSLDLMRPTVVNQVTIGSLSNSEATLRFREFFATKGLLYLLNAGFQLNGGFSFK